MRIKDILNIKNGKDQKEIEDPNGIYNIYGTGGIIGKTNRFLYDKESVGIGRKGTIDKPFYFSKPFWTVDTLFWSEIKKGYYPKFIYHLFQTINWHKLNQSTGVPSLTSHVIEIQKVYVPLLEEQIKLTNFLDTLDKKIEILKAKISILKKYKKGLLKNILISKEYTIKLGQFCEMYQPQTITQNLFVFNGDYPVYGANGIIGYYNNFNHMNSEVVIGCRGNCESVILTNPFSWINGNAMVIKIIKNINISKDELFYLLQTVNFHKYIEKSGVPQITCKKAKQIEIPYPSNYSKIIMLGLKEVDKKIDKFTSTLSITNKCKTYLLKNLFI